ncbi:MAG TPA: adenylate/guanylate cyclase domain-containing protein [Actinomycetota bacterium]|nr:adenylate/guanylate cyclase domain-containing protein [Actinomycetota bacterium]
MPDDGRRLETVLFLDMVGSTAVAARLGDARWRGVLTAFNRVVRMELKRFEGHEEDTAGDGFFATFTKPTAAVRCGCAIVEKVRELGLEVRVGIHTGETESIDRKRGGLGVVIGARVMSLGGAGEVLVTSTTKDLVTGSGLEFESLSAHELKGVPGTWQVFGVTSVDGEPLGGPLPAEEAVRRSEQVEPTSFARQRAKPLTIAVVGLIVLIAAIAIFRVATAPSPVTVFAVNPSTNAVGPVLRDGVQSLHRPNSIYFDGSSLWQATPPTNAADGGKLLRRDPKDGAIKTTQIVPTGDGMGFGFGYAWTGIGGETRSQILKIDPASGRTLATIDLPGTMADAEGGPTSIWYLSEQGDLLEIDPASTKIVNRYTVPAGQPTRVVPLIGSIWVCDCPNGKILQVDPKDGSVEKTVALQQHGYLIGADSKDGNTLWLVDPEAGTITPLDPKTGAPGRPLGFGGSHVYAAEIGFGSIWVAAGSHLYRFDLPDGAKHEIPVPGGASAGGLAMDETDNVVWVENCGCPDN